MNLITVVLFQVFQSNANNHMTSSNYFYLQIAMCLRIVTYMNIAFILKNYVKYVYYEKQLNKQ